MKTQPQDYDYWPLFCEENIWRLCQRADFAERERQIVFISNPHKTCALWQQRQQRAAGNGNRPVVWDYHVVLFVLFEQWTVWDLDSVLPLGEPLVSYLSQTFPAVTQQPQYAPYQPRFRVIDAQVFVPSFSSDRSHMRNTDGSWIAEPPLWPSIIQQGQLILRDLTKMQGDGADDSLSLAQLRAQFDLPNSF